MTSGWQLMASTPRTSAEGRRLSDSPRRLISIGPAGRPGPRQPARLSAGAAGRCRSARTQGPSCAWRRAGGADAEPGRDPVKG